MSTTPTTVTADQTKTAFVTFAVTPTKQPLGDFYESNGVHAGMKRALGDISPSPDTKKRARTVASPGEQAETALEHFERTKGLVNFDQTKLWMRFPLKPSHKQPQRAGKHCDYLDDTDEIHESDNGAIV
jgi:hypothetical protein